MSRKCFVIIKDIELTLSVWKDHFHILNAFNLIYSAWNQVINCEMNYVWKKLWPECAPDRDFDGFEADSGSAKHSQKVADDSSIIDDTVTM